MKDVIESAVNNAYTKVFLAEYTEGDIVATPRNEKGVVAAVMTENFEFPTGDEATTQIEASSDSPAYIVGFGGESAVYRASDVEKRNSMDTGSDDSGSGEAIETVDHIDFDETDLPEGWDRKSLVDWWASIGGTWEDAVDELRKEPDFISEGIDPKALASDWKTQLLGTDRWRNRF